MAKLGITDEATRDYAKAVTGADLIVIATPVGTNGEIARMTFDKILADLDR